jgi:isopenicillin-N N-acyltransferase-like protein
MFPVIDVRPATDAREQGVRYGRACAARIRHSRDTYTRLFGQCGIGWAQACDRALAMQPAIRALDPALLDEMHGIAQGSGLSFEDILALNCRSEILPSGFLDTRAAARQPTVFEEGECTAIGVAPGASADGRTWLAQNWDWVGTQRDALVLLRGHAWRGDERGREFLTLTEAGMLAKIGMGVGPEPDRVAVGLNIIRSRHDGERPATPIHPLLRHLMTMPSLAAARARMDGIQAGFGFGAGSDAPAADTSGEVAAFEVSPRGWQEWPAEDGVMTHTNHFLSDALVPIQQPTSTYLSSETRLDTARRHAGGRPLGLEALQALLRDEGDGPRAVCRSPDPSVEPDARVESVAGVIMSVEDRAMWVAPDVPSTVSFERVN